MPRVTIPKSVLIGNYPSLPIAANAADLTFTASTGTPGANGNQIEFGNAGTLVVVVWNTHASQADTFTITSVADRFGRTGDLGPYSLEAGDHGVFVMKREGFRQSNGMLYCEASDATLKIAAIEV